MTGNWATTPGCGHLGHRCAGADPQPLSRDIDAPVHQAADAHQTLGATHVLLKKLHHVRAACDVLGRDVVAAGLRPQR